MLHLAAHQIMPRVMFMCYSTVHRGHMQRLLDRNVSIDRDVFDVTLGSEVLLAILSAGVD